MRILVECTYVYDHPRDNSGIQRVVRNIVTQLGRVGTIAHAVPVILKNDKVYQVKRLGPDNHVIHIINRMWAKLVRIRNRYWLYHPLIANRRLFRSSPNMRHGLDVFYKIGDIVLYVFISLLSHLCRRRELNTRIAELTVRSDDVLVLLDSSWHSDCFDQVEKLKRQGVVIVSVIYDVIPLTHPWFCDEGLVMVFNNWFKWISRTADGFVAISKASRDQARRFVAKIRGDSKDRPPWFDYFYLGSELDLAERNGSIRAGVTRAFDNGRPVYLMVGTIEPRKNHTYLLETFEQLWRLGWDVSLCLVGKIGWKCDALIERIQHHPERERRLFMFNDLSDTELEFCYRKSRSLVFPAYVEGFGLPLVEAMQRGLPVMAGDIPVFHEVGGDYIAYFEIDKPETLAALIQQFEADGRFPAPKALLGWSWITWADSAQQLTARIVHRVNEMGWRQESEARV